MEGKEFKGTPTPWEVINKDGLLFVHSPKKTVLEAYGQEILADDYHNEDWKIHDATLVAAAPELLKSTKELLALLSFHGYNHSTEIYEAKRAIEKALDLKPTQG